MEALDNNQRIPLLDINVESLEEKSWRKAGADISDYFNYGFDEHSWNAYCKKQTQLCAASRLYNKTRFQRGQPKHGKTEPCCSSSSGTVNRKSSAIIDPTGRWPRSSSTVVGTMMSPEEGTITSYNLNPEPNFSSFFTSSTSSSLYQPGSPLHSLDSGHARGFDDSSSSSGVSSSIPGSLTCSARVINTAKALEYMARSDKDGDRDRTRVCDSKKESESCFFLLNSGEERIRHGDTVGRGHKNHSFKGVSGEKGRHIQRKKSNQCSSGRRKDGEDRESQSRHKHKKAKRNRKKDKKIFKMSSSDPERKLKYD